MEIWVTIRKILQIICKIFIAIHKTFNSNHANFSYILKS